MKRSSVSPSSTLLSALLMPAAALLVAGCSVQVDLGSDVNGATSDVHDTGHDSGDVTNPNLANEVAADGKVDCHVKLTGVAQAWGDLELSNQDMTASSQDTMSNARATSSHIKGKWYFEVRVEAMPGGTWWAQNIGAGVDEVTSDPGDMAHMGASYNKEGSIAASIAEIGEPGGEPYGTGDTIGVAADLESGKIYFRLNGTWQNGDPALGSGGAKVLTVPGTGSYYPFLSLSDGDRMTANFGESMFGNPAPDGYAAFADGLVAGSSGDCKDPGPLGVPAAKAPMTATCDGFTSHDSGSASATELNIVSIYSAANGTSHVHVDRQTAMTLVLASHDAVKWTVTAAPGAKVQRILVSSSEPSSLSAPDGIPVDTFAGDGSLGSGYTWPNAKGGGDTPALVANAESESGLLLTSFGGCSQGADFTLTN